MSDVAPNSPEAKRAAQKVRTVFLLIAAANILLIALMMWPRTKAPEPDKAPTPQQLAVKEMEAISDAVLAAYNAKDAAKFAASFSPNAVPPANDDYFQRIVVGVYHDAFGEVTSKKMNEKETNADPDYGMLVYDAECKKHQKSKLSVNFRRENGALKVMQWRLEKL